MTIARSLTSNLFLSAGERAIDRLLLWCGFICPSPFGQVLDEIGEAIAGASVVFSTAQETKEAWCGPEGRFSVALYHVHGFAVCRYVVKKDGYEPCAKRMLLVGKCRPLRITLRWRSGFLC